jgi:DNA-binding transcriptional MocR family regulator
MWEPSLPKTRPLYRAIVAALQRDINKGELTSGERLPTHRQLSQQLDVTVGTVTKAFTEAERIGLLVSRVGRGSYVLQFPESAVAADSEPKSLIDLSVNTVTIEPFNNALNKVLGALSRRKSLYGLLEYHPVPGMLRHRAAGVKWLRLRGLDVHPDNVILCNGSQEGLMAALATVTKPGDAVLTESLNYAGVKRLADLFRLDIRGVPTDERGLRPDMLVEAAKDIRVGAILCSPTLHNPTNATMPLERRREILAIAAKLDTCVIEDDSNGHLSGDERPTMTSINPDRCIYLCGTSKSMAPGLRIGYMVAPTSILPRLSEGVHATSWTSPSLMGEITSVLIEERIAENFLSWHRKEAVERMKMAENILGLSNVFPNCPTYHLWLQLPAPWRANEFAAHLRLGNTLVSPADVFAVDRNPTPHAIRVSLGGVAERSRLAEGLRVIAEALTARPSSFSMAI